MRNSIAKFRINFGETERSTDTEEKTASNSVISRGVVGIIWRRPRESIWTPHVIWRHQSSSIQLLTSQPPAGHDSRSRNTKLRQAKSCSPNPMSYFWSQLLITAELLPRTACHGPTNYLSSHTQKNGNGRRISGHENVPNLCTEQEGRSAICCVLQQLSVRTPSRPSSRHPGICDTPISTADIQCCTAQPPPNTPSNVLYHTAFPHQCWRDSQISRVLRNTVYMLFPWKSLRPQL